MSEGCKKSGRLPLNNYRDFEEYRRLGALREKGLNEMFFSLNDPNHKKEYLDIVAELHFYRLAFEVVELQEGVVFVFLSEEVAKHIGIEDRRNVIQRALADKPENN